MAHNEPQPRDPRHEGMEFRPYAPGDEGAIIDLFQTVYRRPLSPAFWRWRFQENPSGHAVIELAWSGGRLAAHYLTAPIRMWVDGEVVRTGLSGTTMTGPDFRGMGLFPRLAVRTYDRMLAEGMPLVWGFPNANSHRGFVQDLAWADVCEVPTFTLPLGRAMPGSGGGAAELAWDDPRLDPLWARASATLQIAAVRDAAHVRWRYGAHPDERYRLTGVGTEDLRAWAVWKRYGDEMQIVDLLSDGDADAAVALVLDLCALAQGEGMTQVNLWMSVSHPLHRALEKVGFGSAAPVTYFGARVLDPAFAARRPYDHARWYLARGDSDVY